MSVSTVTANAHTNNVHSKPKNKSAKQPAASPQPQKQSPQNTRSNDQHVAATFSTPQRPARAAVVPVTAPAASSQAPASAKKDLNHLVGRPLVPFYLSDGVENTDLSCIDDEREWGKTEDGKQVKVRQFVDGYFVNSGVIGQPGNSDNKPSSYQNQSAPNNSSAAVTSANNNKKQQPSVSGKPPLSYASVAATPVKAAKKCTTAAPPATPAASVDSSSRPQRYAAPAFNNSPSPLNVPMPKFLSASKPSMPSTAEERDPSDQTVNRIASHISLANKFQQQPSSRQLQQAVDGNNSSSATHDSETSLPLSLMHLVNAPSSAASMPAVPTLVTPDSFPLPASHLSVVPPVGSSSVIPHPVSSPSGDAPKLLFLRQSSAGGTEAVVTHVPLAPQPLAPQFSANHNHVPPVGFQPLPNHYAGAVTHTRPWSQNPTPHFAPSHSVGSANPMHIPPSFHHQAPLTGHGHYSHHQMMQQQSSAPPGAFNPYATGPMPLHHLPPTQHLYQPELSAAVKHLSLMHQH